MRRKPTTNLTNNYYCVDIKKLDSSAVSMLHKITGVRKYEENNPMRFFVVRIVGIKQYVYSTNFSVGEEVDISKFLEIIKK